VTDNDDKITYGRTPTGQLIYDLLFAKLKDASIARKHRLPIQTVRDYRVAAERGFKQGKQQARQRKAKGDRR
jgi:hypothetical protein